MRYLSRKVVLVVAAVAAVAAAQAPNVFAQSAGVFTRTGDMTMARVDHTATLLLDGRVLITGGYRYLFNASATAELYDPSAGTFAPTADMSVARVWHTATLLPDGKVLIAGGGTLNNGSLFPIASAEIYDPSTGTFSVSGNMISAHACHQAILLGNGKVLIVGGSGGREVPGAELYDPATGTFSATGPYTSNTSGFNGCHGASSALLPDGKVLIVWEEHAVEVYDPNTGTFSSTGPTSVPSYNDGMPTATLLMDGKVLVAGGANDSGFYRNADLYDRSTGTFGSTGNMATARSDHTATLLSDGTVLLAGGIGSFSGGPVTSAEIYDPASSTFSPTGTTTVPQGTATLLNTGQVLVAGVGWPTSTSNAELYTPSVLVPVPVVTGLRFDRMSVATGSSYSANFSGSNLTDEMFFDVRFTAPGSNDSAVVLNWQTGLTANHSVPAGTTSGIWTINGGRAHRIETDHIGNFVAVSATIAVSP